MWADFFLWEFGGRRGGGGIILKASGKRNDGAGEEGKQRQWKEERKKQIRVFQVHPNPWHEYQCLTLKQLPFINK